MSIQLRDWLLQQMNARDSLDGVVLTVKVAVTEFGPKQVARTLRLLARRLEHDGALPGVKLDTDAAGVETSDS